MEVLFLKYNKVTNQAFDVLSRKCAGTTIDLSAWGPKMDHLSVEEIESMVPPDSNSIVVGDVFWPTGQNVCRYGAEKGKKVYFLQHGQWIYTRNKQNPPFVPFCTFVNGTLTRDEVSHWEYGRRSKVVATGNPRYDGLQVQDGDYVYFAPPVMQEVEHSGRVVTHLWVYRWLNALKGLERKVNLKIHPHYREADVRALKAMFAFCCDTEVIDPAENPLDHICKCSKVLTHRNSTTVLDAIACRKPVVLMNFDGVSQSCYPEGHFGPFARESHSRSECELWLKDNRLPIANYDEKASRYVVLGDASDRITSIIQGYMNCS